MPVTIDATVGGANANSYVTLAEADAYHDTQVESRIAAWTDAIADEKNRALVTATRLLDAQMEWAGSIASITQSLQWPRVGAEDHRGILLSSNLIPTRVKDATAEFARQLLEADRAADSQVETEGIAAIRAGNVEIEFSGAGAQKVIPDVVAALLDPLGMRRWGSGVVALERT